MKMIKSWLDRLAYRAGYVPIEPYMVERQIGNLKVRRHDLMIDRMRHKKGSERYADMSKELSKLYHNILKLENGLKA